MVSILKGRTRININTTTTTTPTPIPYINTATGINEVILFFPPLVQKGTNRVVLFISEPALIVPIEWYSFFLIHNKRYQ